jgi:Xaa-Pro aminopeptidase
MAQENIGQFRAWMAEQGVDAFIVTQAQNRTYLSGWFNYDIELAGMLLIGQEQQILLTNKLYKEIAEKEAVGWQVIIPADRVYSQQIVEEARKYGWKKIGFESADLSYQNYEKIQSAGADVFTLQPFSQTIVEQMRLVKQPHEIELLKRAFAITDEVFAHLCNWIRPGMTEKEVEREINCMMISLGDGPGFAPIVAAGPNGSMPHAHPGEHRIQRGELITLDIGALYHGYHADMTRTICLGEPAQPEARERYDAVLRAMKTCEAGIHAGLPGKEADALARGVLEQAGLGEYFVHATGHSVGMQIHEASLLAPEATDTMILQAGNVVTIEPGIYIPGWGGIRVEDSVLVTEHGREVLTRSSTELVVQR